jgi:hypothetical protein
MSSYKNLAIIPPFQSRVALVENLWKPPKSTEFNSLLGAPPQHAATKSSDPVYIYFTKLELY